MGRHSYVPKHPLFSGTQEEIAFPVPLPRQQRPPVDSALVHRPTADDVLPTGWQRLGDSRFQVSLRWRRERPRFAPVLALHSPLLIVESMRQSAILLSHTEYAVPLGQHFVMHEVHYTAYPEGLGIHVPPGEVTAEVTCSDVRGGRRITGMNCTFVFRRGGVVAARGEGRLGITSPAAYRRMRGERSDAVLPHQPAGVDPRLAGCRGPAEVLLALPAERGRWQLRVDPRHPELRCSALDHFPGTMLVNACCQAARAATAPEALYPRTMRLRFERYAEFSPACWVEARPVPTSSTVLVAFVQNGRSVLRAELTMEPLRNAGRPGGLR
ncbi:ScbA/BarX family gamma-butyrolactone biosynthesis protein [Streptomyces alanosinicus]|uniref:Adhesin n=1 Tax=Streptomyces alanosinicus TaxID=68171 RepID=A0A918YT28_9ACTN|nr:ScbA/BarX family gamma-butyrolactone biosynthesis protein [Streptomyces alanosinicus]GHE15603.1 adhesin [Streptomyces alanosinicus]